MLRFRQFSSALCLVALLATLAVCKLQALSYDVEGALNDYVNAVEPEYGWYEVSNSSFTTLFGGQAHVLNVTSQRWLESSKASGPNGELWTHQVVVIIPKGGAKPGNINVAYLTGGCNENANVVPKKTDEDILVADELTRSTGSIGIVVFQIPNCPIVFPSDPTAKRRTEDAVLAYAWYEYLNDPTHNATWFPRLPMAKGAFQCMRAAEEFLAASSLIEPSQQQSHSWLVAGASKRGWTTWMVGSVTCAACPKIAAIAPLVPVVPDIAKEMHSQIRSYGGWTFAFQDYYVLNLTAKLNSDIFQRGMAIINPISYLDRLKEIPKLVVLSSDDEFLQFDWTAIWLDELPGETHLQIADNAEHSLATGLPEVLSTLSVFVRSLSSEGGGTRPTFEQEYNASTGAITVRIPEGVAHGKVVLRHAETLQSVRRDFRWVRQAPPLNNHTEPCTFPFSESVDSASRGRRAFF